MRKRLNLSFHARVNQREEAYHTSFLLHIAHGNVEIIIHSYIAGELDMPQVLQFLILEKTLCAKAFFSVYKQVIIKREHTYKGASNYEKI